VSTRNPRFPHFDSLRAIAALMVLGFHAALLLNRLSPWYAELNAGVAVFFVISAFLLYRPYARARFAGEARPALAPYAVRRFFRIVPAYWVALLLVSLWLGLSEVFTAEGILRYFGFANAYDDLSIQGGVRTGWSLCVEVTFYALLPVWAWGIRRVSRRTGGSFAATELIPLAILFGLGVAWKIHTADLAPAFGRHLSPAAFTLPAYLDHFALGMALAVASVIVAERERQPFPVRVVERASWVPWLVAAGAYVLIVKHPGPLGDGGWVEYVGRHELKGVLGISLIVPAVFGIERGGVVRRILANRALLWVGLVSYALYLWHWAILLKLRDAGVADDLGGVGFTIVGVAAALAVSAASYYLLERYALAYGARLARRLDRSAGTRPTDSLDPAPARVDPA
jgi:peptidoglycan/LPS O-acetylase OafA/YrhL